MLKHAQRPALALDKEGLGSEGLFGWAVAMKKVVVGCELWKKML
jgi:hypothetical protein